MRTRPFLLPLVVIAFAGCSPLEVDYTSSETPRLDMYRMVRGKDVVVTLSMEEKLMGKVLAINGNTLLLRGASPDPMRHVPLERVQSIETKESAVHSAWWGVYGGLFGGLVGFFAGTNPGWGIGWRSWRSALVGVPIGAATGIFIG